MKPLHRLSAGQLRRGYLNRSFTPVEVVEALADRIRLTEPAVHAFTTLGLDEAIASASAASAAYAAGRARRLEGIPFAVKDLFDTRDLRTTYGSKMFADHVPRRDAEAVARLRQAGAIMVGKTATHEFAWGVTSVNHGMGSPHNPWAPDRITGGSSGGSAAAVAAGQVPVALASDTGGSIRIPAAFCGVIGYKPTYGLISAAGIFPLSPSLDHVGLMVRDPADLPELLQVLGEKDLLAGGVPALRRHGADGQGSGSTRPLRVGLCRDLRPVRLGEPVTQALEAAAATWTALGARVAEVKFPEAGLIEHAFGWTQRAEALDTHTTRHLFPQREAEYGTDVRARLQAASEVTLPMYLEAQRWRDAVREGFRRLFQEIDVLLSPISPISPPVHASDTVRHLGREMPFRELVMPFVVPQDLAGLPAVAVRGGFDAEGLPVGLQISGPAGSDQRLLSLAAQFYDATTALQATWPEPRAE